MTDDTLSSNWISFFPYDLILGASDNFGLRILSISFLFIFHQEQASSIPLSYIN